MNQLTDDPYQSKVRPIDRLIFSEGSVKEFADRLIDPSLDPSFKPEGVYFSQYIRDREPDEPPHDRVYDGFSSDFWGELSEYVSLENIREISFYNVKIANFISDDFFQLLKKSLRRIEFTNCYLPHIPDLIFDNLNLHSLSFRHNQMVNFRSVLLAKGLQSLKQLSFTYNSMIDIDYTERAFMSDYKVFHHNHKFNIESLTVYSNYPKIDTEGQLYHILRGRKVDNNRIHTR